MSGRYRPYNRGNVPGSPNQPAGQVSLQEAHSRQNDSASASAPHGLPRTPHQGAHDVTQQWQASGYGSGEYYGPAGPGASGSHAPSRHLQTFSPAPPPAYHTTPPHPHTSQWWPSAPQSSPSRSIYVESDPGPHRTPIESDSVIPTIEHNARPPPTRTLPYPHTIQWWLSAPSQGPDTTSTEGVVRPFSDPGVPTVEHNVMRNSPRTDPSISGSELHVGDNAHRYNERRYNERHRSKFWVPPALRQSGPQSATGTGDPLTSTLATVPPMLPPAAIPLGNPTPSGSDYFRLSSTTNSSTVGSSDYDEMADGVEFCEHCGEAALPPRRRPYFYKSDEQQHRCVE